MQAKYYGNTYREVLSIKSTALIFEVYFLFSSTAHIPHYNIISKDPLNKKKPTCRTSVWGFFLFFFIKLIITDEGLIIILEALLLFTCPGMNKNITCDEQEICTSLSSVFSTTEW